MKEELAELQRGAHEADTVSKPVRGDRLSASCSQTCGEPIVMQWKRIATLTLPLALVVTGRSTVAQTRTSVMRPTIPEQIARGAVGGTGGAVPSGPSPSVAHLLEMTDAIVSGQVGSPHGYLSDDQTDIYTDYPIIDPVVYFQSTPATTAVPGRTPTVTVTLLGGTIVVNGTEFTSTAIALPALSPGMKGLFLLHREGGKYFPVGLGCSCYGAFAIVNGGLAPLVVPDDPSFAPDYRGMHLRDAVQKLLQSLHSQPGR